MPFHLLVNVFRYSFGPYVQKPSLDIPIMYILFFFSRLSIINNNKKTEIQQTKKKLNTISRENVEMI